MPFKKQHIERNWTILSLRRQGKILAEIGAAVGLSHEGTRQVIVLAGRRCYDARARGMSWQDVHAHVFPGRFLHAREAAAMAEWIAEEFARKAGWKWPPTTVEPWMADDWTGRT